jgi:hypothetical protein
LITAFGGLAACGGGGESLAPFEVVFEDQRASLLSIWSDGADDVWVVGGEDRSGAPDDLGPIVKHYDGSEWTELDTGERELDLWWVHGFAGGPIYIGGSGGAILRYQDSDSAPERMETPGIGTVFGLWGATADDVWAVGGTPGGASGGFAWHYDGSAWNEIEVPADIADEGTIWKISGRAPDDIWMSGTLGFTAHYGGGDSLERLDVPLDVSLLGISCNDESFISAGGDPAAVVENDGSGWVEEEVPVTLGLTGVLMSHDDAYVVGQTGTILRRDGGDWVAEDEVPTFQNLHGGFIDTTGGVWIAGGNFLAANTSAGVLLHRPAE